MLYNINHFTISEAAVDLEIHWQNCKIVDHNRDCKIVDRNEVDRNDRYDRAPHLDYHLWYEVGFDGHWKQNILEYSFYDYIKFCDKGGFFSPASGGVISRALLNGWKFLFAYLTKKSSGVLLDIFY